MPGGAVRIVLAGGGTGGHVYPALAIAEIAARRLGKVELLFIGVRGRAEEHIVPAAGIAIEYVQGMGLPSGAARLPRFGAMLAAGTMRARGLIAAFGPQLVVATGGYSSAPTVFAAATLRALHGSPRLLVHEQNALPGRMNRVAGRLADRACTTFESSNRFFPAARVLLTGYPVRSSIGTLERLAARALLGIDAQAFVVLAFGGSGGSRSINRCVADALPELLAVPGLHVLHGTGRYFASDYDPLEDTRARVASAGLPAASLARYRAVPYIDDMGTWYAAADLVVARTGAGTLSELARARVPSILVPKIGLPHEHQLANARDFERRGFGRVVVESDDPAHPGIKHVPGQVLAREVLGLASDRSALDAMSSALRSAPGLDTETLLADAIESLVR